MKKFFKDFKAFISRGNILDMAVGVVIGSAFGAIVTALVNILLSICLWAVPGGIKGLVTVLYPMTDAQKGLEGVGQSFQAGQFDEFALKVGQNAGITETGDAMLYGQGVLNSKYTLHGTKFTYNGASVIDWGTFINAILSFIIIALVLFIIVKVAMASAKKREALKAKAEEAKYKKWAEAHPEEAAELEAKKAQEAEEEGKPEVDPVVELLTQIIDNLSKDKDKDKPKKTKETAEPVAE